MCVCDSLQLTIYNANSIAFFDRFKIEWDVQFILPTKHSLKGGIFNILRSVRSKVFLFYSFNITKSTADR